MADKLIMHPLALPRQRQSARAVRLGGRLNLAGLETAGLDQFEVLAKSPLLLRSGSGGVAAPFPYGTVVFIGVSDAEQEALQQQIGDRIEDRLETSFAARSEIEIGTGAKVADNLITVKDLSLPSLVVVADALAKNVALSFEEEEVRKVLAAIEPFTADLADSGRLPRSRRRMLRTVGQALRTHHRLLERVEVEERPDLPPDDDEIGRLHEVLTDAFHFKKRAKSLSRKLDAVEVMTTALTELIDAQREIRVEALIVLLIAVEIAIWLYELFARGAE